MQVSPALLVSGAALLLLQGCCTAVRGWKVLKNGATELLPQHRDNSRSPQRQQDAVTAAPNGNSVGNRAKSGGRGGNTVPYSEYHVRYFDRVIMKQNNLREML